MSDDTFDLDDVLGYGLAQAGERVQQAFTRLIASEGITVRHFWISALIAGEGLTAAELARRMHVTPQAIKAQVDVMQQRGVLERVKTSGRRGSPQVLVLTDAGRAVHDRVAARVREQDRAIAGHLDAPRRAELLADLRRIGALAGRWEPDDGSSRGGA